MQKDEHTIPEMVEDVRAGKMPRRQFMKKLTSIGITSAGVGAIVAATSTASASTVQVNAVDHGGNATHHLQLHKQHLQNQEQGNKDALQNDYADHAIVEDSMHPLPFVGRAAIMARKGVGMAAIPDLKINVTNRVAQSNQVTVEWVATGTHSGDFPGLPASGRPFTINGVTVVVRENGKIVRESLYYDMDEVRRQLGPR